MPSPSSAPRSDSRMIGSRPSRRPMCDASDSGASVSPARAEPAAVGAGRVHRGLQRELEQRVAVEVGGEGVADVADRAPHPGLLALELLQTVAQLRRHGVELDPERSELVVAADRYRRGEVPGGQPLGRVEELGQLALHVARHVQRKGQREHEETDDEAGSPASRSFPTEVPVTAPSESMLTCTRRPPKPGKDERHHLVGRPSQGDVARSRQRMAGGGRDGGGQASGRP